MELWAYRTVGIGAGLDYMCKILPSEAIFQQLIAQPKFVQGFSAQQHLREVIGLSQAESRITDICSRKMDLVDFYISAALNVVLYNSDFKHVDTRGRPAFQIVQK